MDPPDPHPRPPVLSGAALPVAVPPGRTIDRLALPTLLAGLATLAIGWLAFLIARAHVAPAVLFPIGVGVVVGAAQAAIFRKLEFSLSQYRAIALALLLGGLAIATEDYTGYRDYLAEYAKLQRSERLASVAVASSDKWQPAGFFAYVSAVVRREPVWWSIDAVLTPLAAAVVAGVLSRGNKESQASEHDPKHPAASPDRV